MRVKPIIKTEKGREICLRCAEESDAALLIDYLKQTSAETEFLLREPEEIRLSEEEERAIIRRQNESADNVMLMAFVDGVFVGNCLLMGMPFRRNRHRAELAIALFQAYTGQGIGRQLLETLCDLAREQGREQLELEVAAENTRAIHVYESLGFAVCGRLPRASRYRDGHYGDALRMVKFL